MAYVPELGQRGAPEHLSTEQKLKSAERYCELLRSQLSKKLPRAERAAYNVWEQHQVAVYEHHDKDHDHIHIYRNRVPLDGGPAIQTGHNYARNLKAIKTITQELGLTPLPSQRQSFNDSRPPVQDTRQVVRAAIIEAMGDKQVQSVEQLQSRLSAQGIEAKLTRSKENKLVGVSFKQGAAAVTGQEVGFKAAPTTNPSRPRPRRKARCKARCSGRGPPTWRGSSSRRGSSSARRGSSSARRGSSSARRSRPCWPPRRAGRRSSRR